MKTAVILPGRLAGIPALGCALWLAVDGRAAGYVEVGSLPEPQVAERGEAFDAASRTLYSFVYYPPWGNGLYRSHHGAGDSFSWSPITPINYAYNYWGRGVSDGKYLYFTGPIDTYDFVSRLSFAPIGTDGSLGAWRSTTPLPSTVRPRARTLHQVVLYRGRMYILGGWNGSGADYGDAWSASLAGDGTVGAFVQTTPLPEPMIGHSVAVAPDGRLYLAHLARLWLSQIASDGSLGPFVQQAPVGGANHYCLGNNAMVLVDKLLVIVDTEKTFACWLGSAGQLEALAATLTNPPGFGEWSVYAVDGKVYVTATTGKLYRVEFDLLPKIATQPESQTVYPGANVFFRVTAIGAPVPTYQWRLNGIDLSGATNDTLLLASVRAKDAGDYTVVVTNPGGSVTSDKATLRIFGAPLIATQPQTQTGYWGKSVTFTVTASGTEPLTYQWLKDGTEVLGATNASLVLDDLRFEAQGRYTVVIGNTIDTVTSAAAFLSVLPANVTLGLYPGLTLDGIAGKTYGIRYVTDLTRTNDWVALTNLTLTQPVVLWVDTNANAAAPTQPRRFYQIILLP